MCAGDELQASFHTNLQMASCPREPWSAIYSAGTPQLPLLHPRATLGVTWTSANTGPSQWRSSCGALHAILLRCVGSHHLAMHALLDAVLRELDKGELTAMVRPECLQLAPSLCHCHELELLDGFRGLFFRAPSTQPHDAATVVDEEEEVVAATWCCRRVLPTQIPMDRGQGLFCTILHLTRKHGVAMLASQAPSTNLVRVNIG
jgi:hypothetical protein